MSHQFKISIGPLSAIRPKAGELAPHVEAAVLNLKRCVDSIEMLERLVVIGRLWERCERDCLEGTGVDKHGYPRQTKVDPRDVERETYDSFDYVYHSDRYEEERSRFYVSPEQLIQYHLPKLGLGVDAAILSAQVQVWTAFETLAVDLWETAMNLRPHEAAKAAMNQQAKNDESQTRVVSLDALRKNNFNLSEVMGTVLKEERKFAFNRAKDIKAAYLAAFNGAAELFSKEDFQSLLWLEAVRNVIVHRSGIADRMFCSRVSKHPVLAKIEEGKAVPPDARVASELGNAAVAFSATLVQMVDEWLTMESP